MDNNGLSQHGQRRIFLRFSLVFCNSMLDHTLDYRLSTIFGFHLSKQSYFDYWDGFERNFYPSFHCHCLFININCNIPIKHELGVSWYCRNHFDYHWFRIQIMDLPNRNWSTARNDARIRARQFYEYVGFVNMKYKTH